MTVFYRTYFPLSMARSKSSGRWLREHFKDTYVKRAQHEGYRSRAVYKLLELQERDKLMRSGMTIIDLGAAPGSWSQLAVQLVGEKGRVFALDILPIDAIQGVSMVQGDFREPEVMQNLLEKLNETGADLVISDMAPNITGIASVDQPRMMYLAELALTLARQVLKPGSSMLVKVFQGVGFEEYLRELRGSFKQVVVRKPEASRSRSAEVYLLAKSYKG